MEDKYPDGLEEGFDVHMDGETNTITVKIPADAVLVLGGFLVVRPVNGRAAFTQYGFNDADVILPPSRGILTEMSMLWSELLRTRLAQNGIRVGVLGPDQTERLIKAAGEGIPDALQEFLKSAAKE